MILPHPIFPKIHESLVGFLLRAAEENRLCTMSVLRHTIGRATTPPEWEEVEQLSEFCRCSVEEITQLFGFQVRRSDGVLAWRLGDEWITKAHFISSRSTAVCPQCLRNDAYLPGTWELTLYRACAFHRTHLLTRCPGCSRLLRWTRPRLWQCSCGFDLRLARTDLAKPEVWVTAQIIEHRLEPNFKIMPTEVPTTIVDRLSRLSLDGLCKTLWFLGRFVAGVEVRADGHKRQKRRVDYIDAIISEAFSILGRWPESLHESIDELARLQRSRNSEIAYQKVYKPLVLYLKEDFSDAELDFLRHAYEQQLRFAWRAWGRNIPKDLGCQLDFTFDG